MKEVVSREEDQESQGPKDKASIEGRTGLAVRGQMSRVFPCWAVFPPCRCLGPPKLQASFSFCTTGFLG